MHRSSPSAQSTLVGISFVVLAICSVQFGASIAKTLFSEMSPAGITFLRLTIATLLLLLIARPKIRGMRWPAWRAVILLGVSLGSMNLLYYLSLDRIPLGVAVTLELLGPLILAGAQTRRALDWLWVALGTIGIGLIGIQSISGTLDPLGIVLALLAGGCWAAYIVCSQRVGQHTEGVGGLVLAMAVAAVVVAPFGVAPATTGLIENPSLLLPIALVALLSSAVAYALELLALRRIQTRVFGVLMSAEPAAAGLFGFLVLHEALAPLELIAIIIVIVASSGVAATAARNTNRNTPTGTIPLAN
ncbi:EamA family transporter [Humidisolicoccus flavus]|uniref:EamA family transporter n=1 Tax=Humidisolicoccus flavus TaxID=3111414 RepID=UPI003244F956